MSRLPTILDPSKILTMSEDLIEAIGGESDARKTMRESLQGKLDVFKRSSIICKIYSDTAAHGHSGVTLTPEDSENKIENHTQIDALQGDVSEVDQAQEPETSETAPTNTERTYNAAEESGEIFEVCRRVGKKKDKKKTKLSRSTDWMEVPCAEPE